MERASMKSSANGQLPTGKFSASVENPKQSALENVYAATGHPCQHGQWIRPDSQGVELAWRPQIFS